MPIDAQRPSSGEPLRAWSIFLIFLRLGLTSFGGPVAHLGYFRDEFVQRRRWLDERGYADLVALCQFLPGPASSQVGFAIGMHRAGALGALAAFLAAACGGAARGEEPDCPPPTPARVEVAVEESDPEPDDLTVRVNTKSAPSTSA